MNHPDPAAGSDDEYQGEGLDGAAPPGRRSWLQVAGIVAVIGLVALFVVLHLTGVMGGGSH